MRVGQLSHAVLLASKMPRAFIDGYVPAEGSCGQTHFFATVDACQVLPAHSTVLLTLQQPWKAFANRARMALAC